MLHPRNAALARGNEREGADLRVVPARRRAGARQTAGGDPGRPSDENLLKRIWRAMQESDAFLIAAAMAFYAFLSLPPTILVLFALTGFFGGEQTAAWITGQLSALLPEEASGWIDTFVESVVHTEAPGPLSLGLLLALWAASNVFMAVTRALNIAYDVDEERPFIKQRALALGVMLLFVVFFLTGSAALIFGPQIARALEVFGIVGAAWSVAQWVLPFLLIVGAFWLAYYLLPARGEKRRVRAITIGAGVGAAIWLLATIGFRFYVANFASYDETYGLLGGVVVLMLWLYLTMLVILIGGHVAAELERGATA